MCQLTITTPNKEAKLVFNDAQKKAIFSGLLSEIRYKIPIGETLSGLFDKCKSHLQSNLFFHTFFEEGKSSTEDGSLDNTLHREIMLYVTQSSHMAYNDMGDYTLVCQSDTYLDLIMEELTDEVYISSRINTKFKNVKACEQIVWSHLNDVTAHYANQTLAYSLFVKGEIDLQAEFLYKIEQVNSRWKISFEDLTPEKNWDF